MKKLKVLEITIHPQESGLGQQRKAMNIGSEEERRVTLKPVGYLLQNAQPGNERTDEQWARRKMKGNTENTLNKS